MKIWVLYLVVLIGILFAIGFGVLVRQEIVGDTKLGKIDISLISRPAAYIAGLPEQTLKLILKPNPNRINDPWDEERFFTHKTVLLELQILISLIYSFQDMMVT